MTKHLFFSRFGWAMLIVSAALIPLVAFLVPWIFSAVDLALKADWPMAAKIVFQLTIGAWCATFVASAGRSYIWVRARLANIGATEFGDLREEAKTVQTIFVWILGLMTALSGYVAVILA